MLQSRPHIAIVNVNCKIAISENSGSRVKDKFDNRGFFAALDAQRAAKRVTWKQVAEESGVTVAITGLAGVYSDPGHVLVYPDTGEARQQLVVCLHAQPLSGAPRPDHYETSAAAWVDPDQLRHLSIHPSMRIRIEHVLTEPRHVHLG